MDRTNHLHELHDILIDSNVDFDDELNGWWGGRVHFDQNGGGTLELEFTAKDGRIDPTTGKPETVTHRWLLTPVGA